MFTLGRILAGLLLYIVFAESSYAQQARPVDCAALKNSTVPFRFIETYIPNPDSKIQIERMPPNTDINVYRSASGPVVMWAAGERASEIRDGAGGRSIKRQIVFVRKSLLDKTGLVQQGEIWPVGDAGTKPYKATYEHDIKSLDRMRDVQFKTTVSEQEAGAGNTKSTVNYGYKFLRSEKTNVGPCVFEAIAGSVTRIDEGKQPRSWEVLFFPELQVLVAVVKNIRVVRDIQTDFTPINTTYADAIK